jgi:UDP-N-acetylglucosamine diphosphorylase/glucosamine-1-phosphate N-acetyltransferase
MNIILFDSEARNHLLPLTATRPMGEIRLGILTLREKWERYLRANASYITQDYLHDKFPIHIESENLVINAGVVPNQALCNKIANLDISEALISNGDLIAARLNEGQFEQLIEEEEVQSLKGNDLPSDIPLNTIHHLWELTRMNGQAIKDDFALLTGGRRSESISPSNRIIGSIQDVFVESGVKMECCILNVSEGPIYIGKDANIMEGCMLRGPIAIGSEALLKMGARIYGPTTIGPGCRAGGEISRSIMMANSNKGHDGYLGDSVLGEWCNLGADTNTSNLKNNYSEVKLWDYATQKFEKTGVQFCGLFMGDHSKCGINTMFNTGTVVGVFANVYGAGYPRNFVPDFSWGGAEGGYRTYRMADAIDTAKAVLQRRGALFTDWDQSILQTVFDQTTQHRAWDNAKK